MALLAMAGCASGAGSRDWRSAYRDCDAPRLAYVRGIPLASRSDHEQAERFAPADPAKCAVYVVRRAGWFTGPKSAHARAFLYPVDAAPSLPASHGPWWGPSWLSDPVWLGRHLGDTGRELRKAEVFTPEVYAAWELPPGTYVMDGSLSPFQPFGRAAVTCAAGRVTYWAVVARGITDRAALRELPEAEGQALVRGRLRSAGIQAGGPGSPGWVAWRECPPGSRCASGRGSASR